MGEVVGLKVPNLIHFLVFLVTSHLLKTVWGPSPSNYYLKLWLKGTNYEKEKIPLTKEICQAPAYTFIIPQVTFGILKTGEKIFKILLC